MIKSSFMGLYHFYDLLLALTRVSADNAGEVHVSWLAPTHGLAKASEETVSARCWEVMVGGRR